uniref:Large ribosomal subunit protein uL4c n=1 Tax=Scinaia undulata TaxID=1884664 RepID=A0A1G4NXL2_9FLOR|nr:Ribosomal protein L4 [Scinaia undulata]SCW23431.1 Ribosomal protein L4 [Scinaia undulata]
MTTESRVIQYKIHGNNSAGRYVQEIKLKTSNDNDTYIIHRALIKQMQEKRQGNANTKTRSEVRGGGRKPWKQKGTGKARAGSTRSPLWRGGGVSFGPKSKSYKNKLNLKEKQLAISSILLNKQSNTTVVANEALALPKPKTKTLTGILEGFNLNAQEKILVIVKSKSINLYLSSRNLSNIEIIQADHLNAFALLKAEKLIITTDALSTIAGIHNGQQ